MKNDSERRWHGVSASNICNIYKFIFITTMVGNYNYFFINKLI